MSDALRAELLRVATILGAGDIEYTLERPRDPSHGDLATNIAMQIARRERTNPRAVAERVVAALDLAASGLSTAEIAGPGFINFRLAADTLGADFARLLGLGPRYGRSTSGEGTAVNVEFVSANPTGPLHVGHGRGAAQGDATASLLEWTGHRVTREFYVNDAGVQIDRLVESLWARLRQRVGIDHAIPEGGYHGEYLEQAAERALKHFEDFESRYLVHPNATPPAVLRKYILAEMRAEQDQTLAEFGVRFDAVTSEQELYASGKVAAGLTRVEATGLVFEEEGALWLRTTAHGDDRDRVLRKSDGTYTYFLPDIAYHIDKHDRGFAAVIDVWGADHHGYIPRMKAAMAALGYPANWFSVSIVQLVKVVRGGEEVKMSKRSGEFVTLRDLFEEVGVDAARYWFLMRRGDSHLVFDIELAKARTDENPVFYVQMAHARMCGILRNALAAGVVAGEQLDLAVLSEDDVAMVKQLLSFPEAVTRAAREHEPHRITTYLEELARMVHGWYHGSRVLGEPPAVERARLLLAQATAQVVANGLALLGISAPDRM